MRRILCLLVLALAAAACGGDDDATDATTTTVDDGAAEADETEGPDEVEEPDGAEGSEGADGPAEEPATTVPDDQPAAEGDPGDPGDGGDPLAFVAELRGAAEVPGPGDEGATGRAEVEASADNDQLCFDIVAEGLDSAVAGAHVHEGEAGASGGVVVGIGLPTSSEGGTDTWTDVCVDVDPALVEEVAGSPERFYVNLHTETFGSGAIRGQLAAATIFDFELS